jgi:hypothetical protein
LCERHENATEQISSFQIGFPYFAIPKRRRAKYSAPSEVVVIITTTLMTQRTDPMKRHHRRLRYVLIGPAQRDPTNAPRVIRELMSCWTTTDKFHPAGDAGSGVPKTSRNPIIAWNPPIREKSSPYWNEYSATEKQISTDFLFSHREVLVRSFPVLVVISGSHPELFDVSRVGGSSQFMNLAAPRA